MIIDYLLTENEHHTSCVTVNLCSLSIHDCFITGESLSICATQRVIIAKILHIISYIIKQWVWSPGPSRGQLIKSLFDVATDILRETPVWDRVCALGHIYIWFWSWFWVGGFVTDTALLIFYFYVYNYLFPTHWLLSRQGTQFAETVVEKQCC